ncbi:MAG: CPBP family intramembrane metalloprotease [Deltaproteobacteria bacterium]|nr:CPBP family intramembrane metalloprotease [Deltaproteobacteria bacterium]
MQVKHQARITWAMAALALALFLPVFVLKTLGPFDFWWWMAGNASLLMLLVAWIDADWRRGFLLDASRGLWWKILLGMGSAALLYAVFWLGNLFSRQLFDFAGAGIDQVYGLKEGAGVWRMGLLVALIIGPAEELFWRAFLQRRLAEAHGPWLGLVLATTLYTGMHVASLNPMLVLAAGVCGVFWGLLYWRFRSLWLNVLSHTLWDLAVFLVFPLV